MLTFILVLFIFSVLILVHEAGHLIAAKKIGVRAEVFSLGFGKRLVGIDIGGTDFRISLFPFGGYVRLAGEDSSESTGEEHELSVKPEGKRFWVMVAGPLTNYIFAFLLFSIIYMIGVPTLSNRIGEVLTGFPAEKAGIRVGDRIKAVNGSSTKYWDDVIRYINSGGEEGLPLEVEIEREGSIVFLSVKPNIYSTVNVFGQKISKPMIGIAPQSEVLPVSYGPIRACYHGGRKLLSMTAMTYKSIWLLITGGMPVKTSVSGPIGIFHFMGEAAKMGLVYLLMITANVSMALAIFNLLPFPVLDGGHIIFLALEKMRGKPLSIRVQEIITNVAVMLLISFALFVSWQDVMKYTPLGKRMAADENVSDEGSDR